MGYIPCLFSIVYSYFLCYRLIDCKCVGLFLGALFYSTDGPVFVLVSHFFG